VETDSAIEDSRRDQVVDLNGELEGRRLLFAGEQSVREGTHGGAAALQTTLPDLTSRA
jgi:hypothetical protein